MNLDFLCKTKDFSSATFCKALISNQLHTVFTANCHLSQTLGTELTILSYPINKFCIKINFCCAHKRASGCGVWVVFSGVPITKFNGVKNDPISTYSPDSGYTTLVCCSILRCQSLLYAPKVGCPKMVHTMVLQLFRMTGWFLLLFSSLQVRITQIISNNMKKWL